MQKTAGENTKYSRYETILKIGHHAKAIAFENCQFGSKIKIQEKHAKKESLIILELFCAKNRLGKHQIFEK